MQGEVHDPRAHLLGGVAGHAGLFSTAEDLALYAQMMLAARGGPTAPVLAPPTVDAMMADYPVSTGIRGLGWDKQTGYSTNRGDGFSPQAFGHGGFTGTALWIDPHAGFVCDFLEQSPASRRPGIGQSTGRQDRNDCRFACASYCRPTPTMTSSQPRRRVRSVLCGIDVLQRDQFRLLAGQRVGSSRTTRVSIVQGTTPLVCWPMHRGFN